MFTTAATTTAAATVRVYNCDPARQPAYVACGAPRPCDPAEQPATVELPATVEVCYLSGFHRTPHLAHARVVRATTRTVVVDLAGTRLAHLGTERADGTRLATLYPNGRGKLYLTWHGGREDAATLLRVACAAKG